jgi:hypothetical protein
MEDDHPLDDLYDQPLDMSVFRGAVVLMGPNGVHLAMTPDAAERSADLLRQAAEQARAERGNPAEEI